MNRRTYVLLCTGITTLLLSGLYSALHRPEDRKATSAASSHVYRLSIGVPQPGDDLPIFHVTQGDTVTFIVASDRAGEATVHGYERKIAVQEGQETALTFAAIQPGVFPLHLHESRDATGPVQHRHLASIEVQPK